MTVSSFSPLKRHRNFEPTNTDHVKKGVRRLEGLDVRAAVAVGVIWLLGAGRESKL